jgi:hypothetical protein
MFIEKRTSRKDSANMFSLGIRKLVVISLIGGIFLLGNIWLVVNWLEDIGAIGCAKYIRKEYLTGTAITIVIVLLILLVKPGRQAGRRFGLTRRCPVCDHGMIGGGQYCGECGSKV